VLKDNLREILNFSNKCDNSSKQTECDDDVTT